MPHLDGWRIDHAGEPPRLERDARPLWERVGRGLEVDADVLVDDVKLLAIATVGELIPNREHGPGRRVAAQARRVGRRTHSISRQSQTDRWRCISRR